MTGTRGPAAPGQAASEQPLSDYLRERGRPGVADMIERAEAAARVTPGQAAYEALRAIEDICEEIHDVDVSDILAIARRGLAAQAAIAAQPRPAPELAAAMAESDADLLKRAADALWNCAKAALTVEHSLDKPYEEDPRWSPWTRWVERPAREAHNLAMVIRKRLREPS